MCFIPTVTSLLAWWGLHFTTNILSLWPLQQIKRLRMHGLYLLWTTGDSGAQWCVCMINTCKESYFQLLGEKNQIRCYLCYMWICSTKRWGWGHDFLIRKWLTPPLMGYTSNLDQVLHGFLFFVKKKLWLALRTKQMLYTCLIYVSHSEFLGGRLG